jgi:hypothetical protein
MPLRRTPLLALCLLAAACPGPGSAPPANRANPGHAPLVASLQVETAGADSVRLVLQVTNAQAAPLAVTFPSGQSYDFAVLDGARELWRWSADMGFTQAVRTETLAPGETRSYAETWRPGGAPRGRTLTAVARFTSSDHPVQVQAGFAVP